MRSIGFDALVMIFGVIYMKHKRFNCEVCGKEISIAGFAMYNHYMKHVRENKMVRIVDFDNFNPKLGMNRIYRFEIKQSEQKI